MLRPCRLSASCGLVRVWLPVAALALLLLAGCADEMETVIVVPPDETWTAETRVSFSRVLGPGGFMRILWNTSNVGYRTSYVTDAHTEPADNWAYLPLIVRNYAHSDSCSLPIYEGFEGGLVPPAGWTRIQTNPRDTWEIFDDDPYAGSYAAHVDWDDQLAQQNEALLSPPFAASSAELSFYSWGNPYWCRDDYDNCDLNIWLVVGDWGGGDDIYVAKADGTWTATWVWSPMTISLTPYLPAGTPVRAAFEYSGLGGAEVALDQISLTGNCSREGGFDSEFNGSADGWVNHTGAWYNDASYLYTAGLAGTWSSASYTANFADFEYQARMRRYGCDSCANSLVFRGTPDPLTDDNNWYSEYKLQYNRLGLYSVWKRINGGPTVWLVEWTYTEAINQGDAWNTLRVLADGTSLTFYINDTWLWTGTDASLSSGRAGLGMYRTADSTNDTLFVDWARLTTKDRACLLPGGCAPEFDTHGQ